MFEYSLYCVPQSLFSYFLPLFLDEHDMDRVFTLPQTTFIGGEQSALPLREIIRRLEVIFYTYNTMFSVNSGSNPYSDWSLAWNRFSVNIRPQFRKVAYTAIVKRIVHL